MTTVIKASKVRIVQSIISEIPLGSVVSSNIVSLQK